MRLFLLPVVLASFVTLGCSSDEKVICERLAECDLLVEGLSVGECEKNAVQGVPEDRLSACAECVEREDCGSIQDACRPQCEPGD